MTGNLIIKCMLREASFYLRIEHSQFGAFTQQMTAQINGRGLPRVPCILLEGEPEDSQSFAFQRAEETIHYPMRESTLLIVIQHHDLEMNRHI